MAFPVQTLIIGHSFVHRVESYLDRYSIDNLHLPTEHHTVNFLSRGGAHISDIVSLFDTWEFTPDFVILDVGTNDLDSPTPTQELAVDLYEVAKYIL